ncbi:putative hydrolase, alpha/beta hydrolase family [Nocardia nova SH22a]|uniref:Putative hydrolase, alpha/beta hydrolase family n=1 Tax=Nocardia nova SH22a TaxID=1415166 RepID=W5TL22_9NOCA|nr:alpha/beta fold hydrolase [Nocardia nova]AHH19957.1 putative hydrolase, alpha/beta hydrolase family [Nocardia nova SH22a]
MPHASSGAGDRLDIEIPCGGHTLSAWHFPAATDPLTTDRGRPAVVLAHGYGLTRDCGLDAYGARFAAAGIDAVIFDYSGFGASGGGPREVVSVRAQLFDYQAAIAATRALPGIDPDRVALWGTSYSGGLVIAAAALDGRIAAVVSQVPNLDNRATLRFLLRNTPPRRTAWLVSCIARDLGRAVLRRDPYHVQAVGRSDEQAAYVSDLSWPFVEAIAGPTWRNRVGLRDFATVPLFRAVTYLDRLPCRVQFFGCERDDLTPVQPTLDAADRLGDKAELHRYPAGHFEIYGEPYFSRALDAQEEFLVCELAASISSERTR